MLLLSAAPTLGCNGTTGPLVVHADAGTADAASSPLWVPTPSVSWQAQLSGTIDPTLPVDLYYLDPDYASGSSLTELRSVGCAIACYLSAGSFEPWRADAGDFPQETIGNSLPGYPREQWIDIRSAAVRQIMVQRIQSMAAVGCDSIVPVNLDGHLVDNGLGLTADDARSYAIWLADTMHSLGMSAGLSASEDLVADLAGSFDWALPFSCISAGCPGYATLPQSGKTVLLVEYGDATTAADVCSKASAMGFDAIIKNLALDAFRIACGPT